MKINFKPAFSISIFLSSFLLFIVQPLLAKKLLPWFGGSPTVWLSNVLFFQTALLFGYAYAFALTKLKSTPRQVCVHFVLLLASLYFLPIAPTEAIANLNLWPPITIFALLSATLLLPGMMISASSPLLQSWYCQSYQTDFPYRYYALSNFGSLLGLLAYPFLIEPTLGLSAQLNVWSILYFVYLITCSACLMIVYRQGATLPVTNASTESGIPFSWQALCAWLSLTLLSSALLLTVTQVTMQDIVSFPLFWVVPLSLYLISFIITFYQPKMYWRPLWLVAYAVLCGVIFYCAHHHKMTLTQQMLVYSSLLFCGCMICHGELIRLKPEKSHLTTFYLAIALGGVLGGFFVNIVAPLLFNEWWDFYIAVFGTFVFAGLLVFWGVNAQKRHWSLKTVYGAAVCGLLVLVIQNLRTLHEDVILHYRNFFGKVEITEKYPNSEEFHHRLLFHGNILHGLQYLQSEQRFIANSYYGPKSGLALAIEFQRSLKTTLPVHKGLRIGMIGLGTGTIAALAKEGDFMRFYEIDPDMERIARRYFYYLKDSDGAIDVVIGDGRLELDKRLRNQGSENYDVLAIDAFNGDAIPVHLLTLEAMKIYLSHLAPNGILAFHISSRYMDLYPPLQALGNALGLFTYVTHNEKDFSKWISSSEWVLITRQGDLGAYLYNREGLLFRPQRTDLVWTDDFNHLLSIIKW